MDSKLKLIPKGQEGLVIPTYFKNYGINPDKLYQMYDSLRNLKTDTGEALVTPKAAFYTAWLAIKERPNGWYAFGNGGRTKPSDLTTWTNEVVRNYGRNIYKNIPTVLSYSQYQTAAKPYNSSKTYWTKWLPEGMTEAEQYITQRYNLSLNKDSNKIKLDPTYGAQIEVPVSTRVETPQIIEPIVVKHEIGGKLIKKYKYAGKLESSDSNETDTSTKSSEKLESFTKNTSVPSMAMPVVLNTTYAKDKNNKAIKWVNQKQVLEWLQRAQEYYTQNPTDYNKKVLDAYTKASKVKGLVPFGLACIGSATAVYGPTLKLYFSNLIFSNDSNNGFEVVGEVLAPSHLASTKARYDAINWERTMNQLEDSRYKDAKPQGYISYWELDNPDESSFKGHIKIVPHVEPTDGGLLNGLIDSGYLFGETLWNRQNKLAELENQSFWDELDSKAQPGDMVLFVMPNDGKGHTNVPHHMTVYTGPSTLWQAHGDVGEDTDNKHYSGKNFYANENLRIYRPK